MLPLGTQAPDFALREVSSGQTKSLSSYSQQRGLLVMFLCNHCPYVKHIEVGLTALDRDYRSKDVALVAISSNDAVAYPDDAPEALASSKRRLGWSFDYLHDATQAVAKSYTAACTPDFFLFDKQRRLVYRGQFDASRPKTDIPVTGADLRAALDALLADQPSVNPQKPSLGCNIKWRAGNEPQYFPPR